MGLVRTAIAGAASLVQSSKSESYSNTDTQNSFWVILLTDDLKGYALAAMRNKAFEAIVFMMVRPHSKNF